MSRATADNDELRPRQQADLAHDLVAKLGFPWDEHYAETTRAVQTALSTQRACCLMALWLNTVSFNKYCRLFRIHKSVQFVARRFRRQSRNAVYAGQRRDNNKDPAVVRRHRVNVLTRLFQSGPDDIFTKWFRK
jgi:hypothetical protein